jgi:hypothetical protein
LPVFWTAAGSRAPRRFRTAKVNQFFFAAPFAKAVSPLRFATAVQIIAAKIRCAFASSRLNFPHEVRRRFILPRNDVRKK